MERGKIIDRFRSPSAAMTPTSAPILFLLLGVRTFARILDDADATVVDKSLLFLIFLRLCLYFFDGTLVVLLRIGPQRALSAFCAGLSRVTWMATEVTVIFDIGSAMKTKKDQKMVIKMGWKYSPKADNLYQRSWECVSPTYVAHFAATATGQLVAPLFFDESRFTLVATPNHLFRHFLLRRFSQISLVRLLQLLTGDPHVPRPVFLAKHAGYAATFGILALQKRNGMVG